MDEKYKERKIDKNLSVNLAIIGEELGIEDNFDVISREFNIGHIKACMIFIDGLVNDDSLLQMMKVLIETRREEIVTNTIDKLINSKVPNIECETIDNIEQVIEKVLVGQTALLIDKEKLAILIDAREYPIRSPKEPDLERVTRGSRDGHVETAVFNTALIRRRIRDPKLRNEAFKVGDRSSTDIIVSYIKYIANDKLVNEIKQKLKNIDIDALVMGEKSLEEFIIGKSWNPLPKIKFTERPDVVAAHLLEGHIAIIVDTSPSIMLLPVTFFHFTQHAEDYAQTPVVGTYLRWVRFLAIFLSYLLVPVWLLLVQYKDVLPQAFDFLGPKETGNVPLLLQFLILEVGVDLLRMASIHTPNALTTSLGIIGALLLGEFAVKVGLFTPETILYMAIAAISSFAIPSIEFALALRLFRLLLLILTGFFRLPGFIIGLFYFIIIVFTTKSFGGTKYMWPLFPLNLRALNTVLLRNPVPEVSQRPEFLDAKDQDTSNEKK